MKIEFSKMHGAGNDYVYVDCTAGELPDPGAISEYVSHRRFGIGSDGLIMICSSDKADFKMRIFNADRSEYRLLHRQDNADRRLTDLGAEIGLVDEARRQAVAEKYRAVEREVRRLEGTGVAESNALNEMLRQRGSAPVTGSARLAELLRRPQVDYDDLAPFDPDRPDLAPEIREAVQIETKYAGYLARQEKQVEQFRREEARALPQDIDYSAIRGLRLEAREKLARIRPVSLGQAGRISGVSPADIAVLIIYLDSRGSGTGE